MGEEWGRFFTFLGSGGGGSWVSEWFIIMWDSPN
jgi:hypothetical protein